jgi:hypothetical protein
MTKRDPYWFLKKWRIVDITPIDNVYNRLEELEEKYELILQDVVRLEEENIELTNELYRMENSLDARIDILAEHCRINYDV